MSLPIIPITSRPTIHRPRRRRETELTYVVRRTAVLGVLALLMFGCAERMNLQDPAAPAEQTAPDGR